MLLALALCTAGLIFSEHLASASAAGSDWKVVGQPAITAYGDASAVVPYSRPGALIIAGRDNYDDPEMKAASAKGATVLIYIDAIIDNDYGRYHSMLVNSSACGPATSRWPGSPRANSWGHLQDFRVGSVVQQKLKCVLETAVKENPHVAGFFADDLGSRSWFPDFSWSRWGSTNQDAYREGAIGLAKTFHSVASEHNLMLMVNGTWTGGSISSSGGGYPNQDENGLSLADGGYIEHHSIAELPFFTDYADGQWATASGTVADGKPVMYVQATDMATLRVYAATHKFAYLSAQVDYDSAPVWSTFYDLGLPIGQPGYPSSSVVSVKSRAWMAQFASAHGERKRVDGQGYKHLDRRRRR